MNRPLVLIIIDGWGIAPPGPGNAVSLAKLNVLPRLWSSYPHGKLAASGEAVGLPKGEDGNTETGHLNIGAGKVVYQDLPRINMAIADGSFFQNEAFLSAISHCEGHMSNLHLIGLIGSGGVHSNMEHLFALLWFCKNAAFSRVFIHLISDGRDSPPKSAVTYIRQVEDEINRVGIGTIASVMGRYFAMDRDQRWERTEKAYVALTKGQGLTANSPTEAISQAYARGVTDEFIEPTLIVRGDGPIALTKHNDSVIFFNYRIDRPRQLTKAFVLTDFSEQAKLSGYDPYAVKYYKKHTQVQETHEPFKRTMLLENLFFVTMTEYEKKLPVAVAFPEQVVANPLGKVISEASLRQLRVSETEKERFVTYYFNGQREDPFIGEDHLIIPSAKVPTYDLKPEMSADEITEAILKQIAANNYDLIVVNFANPDMVAHTGNIKAAITACEVTDKCVGKIVDLLLANGGACIITSDHGNVEEMIDPVTGGIDTEHSTYPVPVICISKDLLGKSQELPSGMLADIAPTILNLIGLAIPPTMNGRNLLAYVQ
ncbi:MAG: 2,3-bisphosphoglycerate-independent phosphoglycerate mutase [Patescibacteria group bacterium]